MPTRWRNPFESLPMILWRTRFRSHSSRTSSIRGPELAPRDLLEPAPEVKVLADAHVLRKGVVLRHVAHPPLYRVGLLCDPEAADRHVPGRRGEVARQDPHRGRFAGAVGPEEPDDLAPRDREADVIDRRHAREDLHEVGHLDGRLRGGFGHAGLSRGTAALAALLDRHLAGAEPSRVAVLAPQEQRAHVVDAEDPSAPPAAADGERNLAAPQDVVPVPELDERVDVLAVGEALVGEEDAARRGLQSAG